MANRHSTDDTATLSDVVTVVEALPIMFEVGGREWHLRQPTPAEMVRISMTYDIAHHRAWQDIEASQIKAQDIPAMISDAQRLGYWTAQHEAETDPERRRDLAERIVALRREDRTTAWDDIAVAYAMAERDRFALDLLLADDDKADLLAHPGAVREARQHV